jgi:uncharacterized membrane protein
VELWINYLKLMKRNFHQQHKDSLTIGDRVADGMRMLMGSWAFIIGFLVFMGVWIISNGFGIDKAPFGALNLALSAIAGLQSSLIMIAAKRLDDLSAQQAKHMLEVDEESDREIKETKKLVKEMHQLVKEVHAVNIKKSKSNK